MAMAGGLVGGNLITAGFMVERIYIQSNWFISCIYIYIHIYIYILNTYHMYTYVQYVYVYTVLQDQDTSGGRPTLQIWLEHCFEENFNMRSSWVKESSLPDDAFGICTEL